VQSFLQTGTPDPDVLLYYPFYDSLATRGGEGLLKHFGGATPPPEGTTFERANDVLQGRGYAFDFISDAQLRSVRVAGGKLVTAGGATYSTVVIPSSHYVPLETFEAIMALARAGATVASLDAWPEDIAGLADLEARRARFSALQEEAHFGQADGEGISSARIGRGVIFRGNDVDRLAARAGARREALVDRGLQFVRRRHVTGRSYFVLNAGDRDVDGWMPLADRARYVTIFDPSTGQYGDAQVRRSQSGAVEVRVSIPPGQSLVVRTSETGVARRYQVFSPSGAATDVGEQWRLRFATGGPTLPSARTLDRLGSWTAIGGDAAKAFSGTAVYATTFPRPGGAADAWRLDLGRVHESARVRLNGREMGVLLGPSYQLTVHTASLSATNTLEIEVTNLSANRIASLDRAGVPWRKFYNVNFPARYPQNRGSDGLFSAVGWTPLDSGLMGPVTLTPLKAQ
jgi:hypothetical protein